MGGTRDYGKQRFVNPRGSTRQLPSFLANGQATIQWKMPTLAELVSEPDASPAEPPDVFQPGQLVEGKYEIRGVLGAGGMGQVFEARDRGLNRLVAIKASWPHVGAESLKREAQVLAAFRNPGLPTVHALGMEGSIEFLVMERLSGVTLADLLDRRAGTPMPIRECLTILLGLCEALAPLHASGLAHADLKPANIMITPGDRIVLLDFGIARIEQLSVGSQRITGSPHYMAPEAIRGAVQTGAAHLVDLYALGVISYVMLAGQPPFDHENAIELMMMHLHHDLPLLSTRRPDVSPALGRLVAELLAKTPGDRPADIEFLRAELRAIAATAKI